MTFKDDVESFVWAQFAGFLIGHARKGLPGVAHHADMLLEEFRKRRVPLEEQQVKLHQLRKDGVLR